MHVDYPVPPTVVFPLPRMIGSTGHSMHGVLAKRGAAPWKWAAYQLRSAARPCEKQRMGLRRTSPDLEEPLIRNRFRVLPRSRLLRQQNP